MGLRLSGQKISPWWVLSTILDSKDGKGRERESETEGRREIVNRECIDRTTKQGRRMEGVKHLILCEIEHVG